MNYDSIKQLISNQLATGIQINNCKHDTLCECCGKSKLTDAPYAKLDQHRATRVLELIHNDVMVCVAQYKHRTLVKKLTF